MGSSNIPGIVLRFSKLCKMKSVGISSSTEKPKRPECSQDNGGHEARSQPLDDSLMVAKGLDGLEEAVLSKLFVGISALKSGYIQLQQAHIPYEPKKIRSADDIVAFELESISELQHLYMQSIRSKPKTMSIEIKEHKRQLEELQSKLQFAESEILLLRSEIDELDSKNTELEEEIDRKASPVEEIFPRDRELTPSVFCQVFDLAYKSIHEFGKPLISLMKASGWDLNQAACSIAGPITYTEKSHKKYAFEAYLSRAMLCGNLDDYVELDDHFDRVVGCEDPFEALMHDPDSSFGKFSRAKYLTVVPSKMESSFFGNLDQRVFVSKGGHPRTPFYQAFVRMARWAWALQVIACSFIPKAENFSATRGDEYSGEYMESVVNLVTGDRLEKVEVGLTVMPGFRSRSHVIRCKVYPCRGKDSNGA